MGKVQDGVLPIVLESLLIKGFGGLLFGFKGADGAALTINGDLGLPRFFSTLVPPMTTHT